MGFQQDNRNKIVHSQKLNNFCLNHLSNIFTMTLVFWVLRCERSAIYSVNMHARHWSDVMCFHYFHLVGIQKLVVV